jgi:hypothetical protein
LDSAVPVACGKRGDTMVAVCIGAGGGSDSFGRINGIDF